MPSVAVRLDDETKQRLKAVAEHDDRSPHYIMKKAIETYLLERESRIEDERISIERWEEYQRTGVSVPGEKVLAWVKSLPRD